MSDKLEKWNLEITSKDNWLNFRLFELLRYRDLLMLFVKRDIISFYKQTILGPLWYIIQPVFTTIVYTIIFGNFAGISTDGIPKPLFYIIGVTSWNYFSDCLIKTSTVFKDNANIFSKVYFPRIISPLSIVISNLIKFILQLVLIFIIIIYYKVNNISIFVSWHIIFLPILTILMALQGLGLGMLITAMTTKYRDLAYLVSFGVQLMMYATTVIYPLSSIKGNLFWIVALNPMTFLIEGVKYLITGVGIFTFHTFCYSFFISILIFVIGFIIFNKVEKTFVDTI